MNWIEPTICENGRLAAMDVERWKEEGYCLVDGLLPIEILHEVFSDASSRFPAPGSVEAKAVTEFGGGLSFPCTYSSVNSVALHANLQRAVSQLLSIEPSEIRLSQCEVWPKYGNKSTAPGSNSDQRMHCDFPNHTLLCPPVWEEPEAVEMIIYLSEVKECMGATAVVSRLGPEDPAYQYPTTAMPGFGNLEWVNNRDAAEKYLTEMEPKVAAFRATHLYPRERHVRYHFGTALLYRHDTWHRGTELAPDCLRIVMNLTFRKSTSEWISTLHTGWAWAMYREGLQMERLVATATVNQRCLMGFPKPGHPYWTERTLMAVYCRYGPLGFDMTPYVADLTLVTCREGEVSS